MNIVVFGAPLSGKGTHTKFLQNEYGFDVVSTGALLRQHIADQTNLGQRIKSIIDAGDLIAVDDVMDVIEDAYAQRQSDEGVVFDGTPRRVDELYELISILATYGEVIDKIIVLDVPETELFRRMQQRRDEMIANGETPRSDDDPVILRDRLDKYTSESLPVIAEAQKQGIDIVTINGDTTPKDVQDLIADALDIDGIDPAQITSHPSQP